MGMRDGDTAESHRAPRTHTHPQLVPKCPRAHSQPDNGHVPSSLRPRPPWGGEYPPPSARLGAGQEDGTGWVSPLSFECHTHSKVGPWLGLEGVSGGLLLPWVVPKVFRWGWRESNRRPCKSLAMSSYLYIQSLCF